MKYPGDISGEAYAAMEEGYDQGRAEGTKELDDLRALLGDALRLLRSARCELADPGVRRTWGQRRRRWMDAVLARGVEDG